MAYYIGITYNDGGKDVIRMPDGKARDILGRQDRTDALINHIERHYGLASDSGIRSIDMVREVPDARWPDSATETAPGRDNAPRTARCTDRARKPLKTPPSLINPLSDG